MACNIKHIFDYLVTEDIVYPEYALGVCCERQSWIPDGLHTREPAEGTMISGGNKSATAEHADISAVFDLIITGSICFGRSAGGGGGRSNLADS